MVIFLHPPQRIRGEKRKLIILPRSDLKIRLCVWNSYHMQTLVQQGKKHAVHKGAITASHPYSYCFVLSLKGLTRILLELYQQ